MYHEGNRQLQDQFDTRRMADRIDQVLVSDNLANYRELIESRDMFFLATADENGCPNCSYKGGDPGFVKVVDEHTLAFPNYDGNGMYLSMGNILRNPHVGLLFIDLEEGDRLRVNGEASINPQDPLVSAYPEAQFIVRVRATHVFPNCPRYIHQYKLIERSKFVPRKGCRTPVPEWKRFEWAADVLPANDPARHKPVSTA
ncbi:MAG TPA: pyridoxamine 5'-phosphate oxidase family protein [Terriglobales bacterium]|nr:pyridoxamine 5'-phosphate oxidase family protein [Terriglobales bacterium]